MEAVAGCITWWSRSSTRLDFDSGSYLSKYISSSYCQEKTFSKVCTTPSDAWWSVEVTWDDCSRLLLGFQILNCGSFSHYWSLKDHHCCAGNNKGAFWNQRHINPADVVHTLAQLAITVSGFVLYLVTRTWEPWMEYLFRNLLNTSKDLASISWWNGQPVRQKWAKASHPSYLTPQGFLCGKKTKSPNFPDKSHIPNNQASSCNHIVVCIPKYYKIPLKKSRFTWPQTGAFSNKGPPIMTI